MADWVPDRSLPVLVGQVNAAAPGRDKSSDGLKGDAAHAARESDHNPESPPPPGNPDDQVDAADITHDPAHGADMGEVAESIRLSRDRRVRYVIFNRRIFYGYDRPGLPAFTWTDYHGEDPHDGHLHISVNDVHHDETQLWAIGIGDMDQADKNMATATTYRTEATLQHKKSADYEIVLPSGRKEKRSEPNKLGAAVDAIAADVKALLDRPPVQMTDADLDALAVKVAALIGRLPTLEEITAAIGRQDAAGLRAQANMVDAPPA